jgi:hypothetical protein
MDALRDFLVRIDGLVAQHDKEGKDCPFVFVFTDETYIHRTHAHAKSYLSENATINRSSSKGERLIILHAITPDGPLWLRLY